MLVKPPGRGVGVGTRDCLHGKTIDSIFYGYVEYIIYGKTGNQEPGNHMLNATIMRLSSKLVDVSVILPSNRGSRCEAKVSSTALIVSE